jgi:hypothetical protein
MPGLLEGFGEFIKTPEGQGLLSAAFGGLAGAQRGAPLNSIGRAGLAGLTGYSGAIDRASQAKQQEQAQKFRDLQMSQTQMEMAQKQKEQELEGAISSHAQKFMQMPQAARQDTTGVDAILPEFMRTGGGMPAQPAKAGGFDSRGFLSTLPSVPGMNPLKAMEITAKYQPKETEFSTEPRFTPDGKSYLVGKDGSVKWLDGIKPRDKLEFVEGVGVNPYDAANTNRAIPNANKPFSMGADGKPIANTAFQNYEIQKAGAGASRVAVNTSDPTAVAQAAMKLQNDYRAATKPSYARAQAYESMVEAAKNPSPKGDLTMVYSFIKALDPDSVVREGEISLLNANRSVPDSIKGYAQKLHSGQSLLPKEREDLIKQAQTLTNSDYKRSRNDIQAYRDNSKRLGLDPDLYAPDPYDKFKPMQDPALKANTTAKSVTGTGMYQGKKVIRYSDGSIEYAN